jgi:hypothetical protein
MSSIDRGYGINRAVVETEGTPLVATTATTVATVANTLVAGQRVAVTALGGSSLALLTTYYVIATGLDATKFSVATTPGGAAVSMGTGTGVTFAPVLETALEWPNKVAVKPDTKEITWEGGNAIEKMPMIVGMSADLDLDCLPVSAHRTIFGKATMTALPGGFTSGTGFGGGNDKSGVACGFYTEGNAIKTVSGVKTTVVQRRWYPSCIISLRQLGAQGTAAKDDVIGYTITASRATTDILGCPIANVASDGDFIIYMD